MEAETQYLDLQTVPVGVCGLLSWAYQVGVATSADYCGPHIRHMSSGIRD